MTTDPISLTDRARTRIRDMTDNGQSHLRIDLKKGGCAGMEYDMSFASDPGMADIVVEADGARIFLGPMAQMFLLGTEIDYTDGILESGFTFRNPNVTESCGCNQSVSFEGSRD